MVENHKLPRINYSLRFDRKPIVEGDKAGVLAILGAMLGNGTENMPKDEFNDEVDFLGASVNVSFGSASAFTLTKNNLKVLDLCKEEINSDRFFLYSGDDFSSLEFLKNGGHGTISVTSNIVPDIVSEICKFVDTNYSKAKELDDSLKVLNKNLFCESNPIPVKWMLYKMGLIDNILRLPLIELDTKYHEIVSAEMIKLQLI